MTAVVAGRKHRDRAIIAGMTVMLRVVRVRLSGRCGEAVLAERHDNCAKTLQRKPQG